MRESRKEKKHIAFCMVLLALAVPAAAFFLRPPALVVTDASFGRLYGSSRQNIARVVSSIKLFRRLIPVPVAESAGPDLVVAALEAAAENPRAVLFPYRYIEAAGLYKERRPDTPVLVLGGRNPRPAGSAAFRYVRTDSAADLFRAGLCAAFFAGEGKRVLFSGGGPLLPDEREAFREGLRSGGLDVEPVYLGAGADASAFPDAGSAVINGPAETFLEKKPEVPVVLFSWADPARSPRAVKIVFDDSPWALAEAALAADSAAERADPASGAEVPPDAEETLIPSKALILKNRIGEKKDFRKIQVLIKAEFQKK